jgi:hypothetical protein
MKKSGSGINKPDHNSESLATIFGLKMVLKFFVADPLGSEVQCRFDPGPGMEKFGPRIKILDPQH